jgi:hypothetical protein
MYPQAEFSVNVHELGTLESGAHQMLNFANYFDA